MDFTVPLIARAMTHLTRDRMFLAFAAAIRLRNGDVGRYGHPAGGMRSEAPCREEVVV